MAGRVVVTVLRAIALAVVIAMLVSGCGGEGALVDEGNGSTTARQMPAMDAVAPATTETATFALG